MTLRVSRNVVACKLLKCSQSLARGLWNNGILSPYILILTGGSKTAVGLVQGLFGLSTAALALPVGVLSDKTARHIVAKLSAFLDLAAILLTSAGVLASHGKYHLLCAAGIFWGLSTACDSNTDALFADSVPTGQRSTQFTQLQALSLACLGAGPLIAAAIFHSQGNEWTLHQLGIVIMCGMCANIAPVFLKLLIHDKHTLGAESDAYTCAIPPNAATCAIPRGPCARDRVRHDCAAAAVATGVEAHMPAEPVDLKDAQTPLPHHARSPTRGVPSLPAIRSGTAICFDECGKVVAVDTDGSSTGSQRHAASAPDDGAAGSSSDVDRDPVDATATAAPDHGVQGWLQSNHMQEHAADAADSPFVGPLQGGAAREDVREPLLGPATGPPSRDDCAGATPGATPAHTMWTCWPERLVLGPHWVPYLMFSADLISGLASGMTIKFFPIFFMDKALLTPMANSLLFAGTPLGIAAAMFVAQRLASGIGRVPAILCLRWLGVALLLLMAAAPCLWPVPVAILPIYLVRTACANGTSALGRSILMDFVPKERRGRWSSLDGVTMFGWSGSAMLGGYLLDLYGFQAVFVATAAMQFSGSLLLACLLPVVPRHEAEAGAAAAPAAVADAPPHAADGSRSVTSDKSLAGVMRRSGSASSGRSTPALDDAGGNVRWEKTLQPQRLSIDGEEEIAQSFSSSFSGR